MESPDFSGTHQVKMRGSDHFTKYLAHLPQAYPGYSGGLLEKGAEAKRFQVSTPKQSDTMKMIIYTFRKWMWICQYLVLHQKDWTNRWFRGFPAKGSVGFRATLICDQPPCFSCTRCSPSRRLAIWQNPAFVIKLLIGQCWQAKNSSFRVLTELHRSKRTGPLWSAEHFDPVILDTSRQVNEQITIGTLNICFNSPIFHEPGSITQQVHETHANTLGYSLQMGECTSGWHSQGMSRLSNAPADWVRA